MFFFALGLAAAATWTTSVAELRTIPPESVTVVDARGWWDYYVAGHIPGAVCLPGAQFARAVVGRMDDGDLAHLAEDFAAHGVDESRRVVVYGDGREGQGLAGRIVVLLRTLGHTRASLLDGGWRAWLAAGGRVLHRGTHVLAGHFAPHPNGALAASDDDVARAPRAGVVVLDVRSDPEWRGERPFFTPYRQRIRGAVHLAWTELLDASGRLRRFDSLTTRLRALGLRRDTPVIIYSTRGLHAAAVLIALKALGFRDVKSYAEPWHEAG